MARQTSKGICTFCHGEFSKSAMARHLETCQQRAITGAKAAGRQKAQRTSTFHLVVEGRDLPVYWMHLKVRANTTLATLDRFLRGTWLECCGHLSAFEIAGVRYAVDVGMDDDWEMEEMNEKSMRVRLEKVLSPGQTGTYEYDYGTTTELRLRVISEDEVETKGKAIQVLARNTPPVNPCEVCGKVATSASLRRRGGSAMTAPRSTGAVRKCSCRWSTRRVSAYAPIQDDPVHRHYKVKLAAFIEHETPSEEWLTVLRRVVENQELLRKVADHYGVLSETVRRGVIAAREPRRRKTGMRYQCATEAV